MFTERAEAGEADLVIHHLEGHLERLGGDLGLSLFGQFVDIGDGGGGRP